MTNVTVFTSCLFHRKFSTSPLFGTFTAGSAPPASVHLLLRGVRLQYITRTLHQSNLKGTVHTKMIIYWIYTYFEECWECPNNIELLWLTFYDQKSSKYLLLCPQKKVTPVWMTQGWVNEDRMIIFGCSVPLSDFKSMPVNSILSFTFFSHIRILPNYSVACFCTFVVMCELWGLRWVCQGLWSDSWRVFGEMHDGTLLSLAQC